MSLLKKFEAHLYQNCPVQSGSKLLVAVSGGVDSMVLVHLLKELGYDLSIAHCNFGIRGGESWNDEEFVEDYAKENGINFYVTRFDTELFASDNKLSVQVAARQLRYIWFQQLMEENGFNYLLTAHHLDDSLETFLINLSRGTGLDGLTGIPGHNNNIVRPLLPFTRSEIEAYAQENNIEWREDSSNTSSKYLRNKLRHDVVPVLKSLNPSFMESFSNTLQHLQQAGSMVEDASVLVYKQVVTEQEGRKLIDIRELKRLPNYRAYLYQWLSPFGFTAWDDIYSLTEAQSGKQVLSPGYRIVKDRDVLILEPLKKDTEGIYEINAYGSHEVAPVSLYFSKVNEVDKDAGKNAVFVDNQLIKFPLFVRKWQEGDYFYPLGMNGQKKKVSKYFKDEKMSLSDKDNTWILASAGNIVWIIGKRADERFKVTGETTQILKIEVL